MLIFHKKFDYLGDVIHLEKFAVASRTIEAITLEKKTTTVTKMR